MAISMSLYKQCVARCLIAAGILGTAALSACQNTPALTPEKVAHIETLVAAGCAVGAAAAPAAGAIIATSDPGAADDLAKARVAGKAGCDAAKAGVAEIKAGAAK